MYFRLTQVDIQDGKMEDTLAYAASVMDSLKDTPGLFQICIAEMDNCLLYTSPSPRDSGKSRMPSSA